MELVAKDLCILLNVQTIMLFNHSKLYPVMLAVNLERYSIVIAVSLEMHIDKLPNQISEYRHPVEQTSTNPSCFMLNQHDQIRKETDPQRGGKLRPSFSQPPVGPE